MGPKIVLSHAGNRPADREAAPAFKLVLKQRAQIPLNQPVGTVPISNLLQKIFSTVFEAVASCVEVSQQLPSVDRKRAMITAMLNVRGLLAKACVVSEEFGRERPLLEAMVPAPFVICRTSARSCRRWRIGCTKRRIFFFQPRILY